MNMLVVFVLAAQITQSELVRRTQELMDAVTAGNKAPFISYYADDALFFDEKGRDMTKAQLVDDISPLPKGYSGTIKVVNPKSLISGNTAILSWVADEEEVVFGQRIDARYHETDTWLQRNGKWQIVATQVLRYYQDPAVGRADPSMYAKYVGTYELAPDLTITVTAENGHLYAQRSGRAREELFPEDAQIFFRKDVEGRRVFRFDDAGNVDALIDRRNNQDLVWKKTK